MSSLSHPPFLSALNLCDLTFSNGTFSLRNYECYSIQEIKTETKFVIVVSVLLFLVLFCLKLSL